MSIVRFVCIAGLVFLIGCVSSSKVAPSLAEPARQVAPLLDQVVLGPGDIIDVKFRYWPDLDYQQSIRPDGRISLQLIDEVVAAGFTPKALDDHLTSLYSSKLKSPEITVFVVSLAAKNIYVGGEVENPGIIPLAGQMSALQAVFNAGGFKDTAKPEAAIVIRRAVDNQPVPIAINLQQVLGQETAQPDLVLRPDDIVYIPKSPIAKVNLFVKQYIQDLLLYRGVSLGLGYDLNPNDNN